MRRPAVVLSCLLACVLAGCGGTDDVATVPIADFPTATVAEVPPTTTLEPTTTAAPATTEVPTTEVPTTEVPPAPRVVATTPTTEPEVVALAPTGGCDPSYPDVCIPPGPPDLDCADIPHRRFRVVGADPHRFDGNDNDGLGCESCSPKRFCGGICTSHVHFRPQNVRPRPRVRSR